MIKYLYYRFVNFYLHYSKIIGTECSMARSLITVFLFIEFFWLLTKLQDKFHVLDLNAVNMIIILVVFGLACEVILYKYLDKFEFKKFEKKWETPQNKKLGNIFIVAFVLAHLLLIFTL